MVLVLSSCPRPLVPFLLLFYDSEIKKIILIDAVKKKHGGNDCKRPNIVT